MPSELEAAARRFRRDLLRRERAAASSMVRAYGEGWQRIQRELDALSIAVRQAQAAGETVDVAWLYQFGRLLSLRTQIERELRTFSRLAEDTVLVQQQQAVEAALIHSGELLEAALGPRPVGVLVQFDRLPRSAVQQLVGFASDGSPLRTLVNTLGEGVGQGVLDALTTGIVTGMGPREVARLMRRQYGVGLARALTISRTETMRAYREATRQSYQAHSDVLLGWVWHAEIGPRTCPACLAMHGSVHSLDETLDGHPSCRCAMVPLLKSWRSLGIDLPDDRPEIPTGASIFDDLPTATQRAILGPAMYAAWRDGAVSLAPGGPNSVVGRRRDRRWGTMRYARSLRQLVGRQAAAGYALRG